MNYPYADMHCDTLMRGLFENEQSIYDGDGMQSIQRMIQSGQLLQFFAVFFPPEQRGEHWKDMPPIPADEEYFKLLSSQLKHQVELHQDQIAMAHNYEEIMANRKARKASAILTVEDGRMVQGEMETLHYMYETGVRAIALTWNFENCFGYPNSTDQEIMGKGLKPFGIEAVEEMNRLGVLVDVSHLSDGGFYDVAKYSRVPFIASHSNCRALTPHPRNLTDDMIRLLAEKGGVAGINFCPEFISPSIESKDSRIEDLVRHVEHFVQIGGEDCVGIGTDFDGIDGNLEIGHPEQMDLLFAALEKKGFTARQLDKLASGNVLRVIRDSMR